MTQEEKDLLLKDLCARLPYGVKVKFYNIRVPKILFDISSKGVIIVTRKSDAGGCDIFPPSDIEKVVPYLRPMSSMTEEEKKEYHKQVDIDLNRTAEVLREQLDTETYHPENRFTPQYCHIDWLNAHHFDYRGLIPMGLALVAPEDMYIN